MTTTKVHVWHKSIRFFHWLNVICILCLVAVGLVIFNSKALGVSTDGKVLLKTIHVLIGYVFAANLIIRLIFAVVGKGQQRFSKMLPFMKGYMTELSDYRKGRTKVTKGHNPVGKLMVAALLIAMSIQLVTGLFLAGSDIYYPPFGPHFAETIAVDKSKVDLIKPYSKENVDAAAYKELRELRRPFIISHVYTFYALLILIPLHILGVIVAERREKSALTSAMITGYKYLPDQQDENNAS